MQLRVLLLLLIAGSVMADDAQNVIKNNQARIAEKVEAFAVSRTQVTLYSLDPDIFDLYTKSGQIKPEYTNQVFLGFIILGKAEISNADEKTLLLKSFARGIRESDGAIANCFNPRHGLRLITNSSTNDFVICFECRQVKTDGFGGDTWLSIESSPADEFNGMLKKHHLKKAKNDN